MCLILKRNIKKKKKKKNIYIFFLLVLFIFIFFNKPVLKVFFVEKVEKLRSPALNDTFLCKFRIYCLTEYHGKPAIFV